MLWNIWSKILRHIFVKIPLTKRASEDNMKNYVWFKGALVSQQSWPHWACGTVGICLCGQ